ncbi:chromosome segregation protein [Thermotomaculum hydrothermale]|uniref:Chromosome partition protein Smc n=1 Tax=Thermotomaculum hydrothermale TaxID=981385 RepID=A0A7R6PH04_9BACT|nr:chromosome segregation protein SMC [Thermotomaculum hydrothermale]BBB32439.1 chromosome segregation protein [Thermotomaculum hydrothermale]
MYVVKSLKLHGFKTFPRETVIDFSRGITAITGPNGSGKSNIAEALIWVMGEQAPSAFRSGQMEDVIFAGTDKLPPMGMAEVVLKFEKLNPQKGEDRYVEILRRFYREGEGEYRLNGKRVRRKDIQDFLYDIGLGSKSFAMIEQGRITQMIEAKPEERRVFIEEVAGILKYKLKKKEAESKIRLTRENLDRVEDIIAEVRKNLNSLRQQAARARQFKKLQEELISIEKKVTAHKIALIEQDLKKLNSEIDSIQDNIVSLSTEVASIRAELETKKSEILERENDIALLNKDFFEKKLKSERLETEIKNKTEQLENLRKRLENYETELKLFEKELTDLDEKENKEKQNLDLAKEDFESLSIKTESLSAQVASFKEELKSKEEEYFSIDRELKDFETESYKISSDLNYSKKEKESVLSEFENKKQEIKEIEEKINEFKEKIENVKVNIEELTTKIGELRELKQELAFRLEELNQALTNKENEKNSLLVEIKTLENRYSQIKGFLENREGFSENVKKLIKEKSELISGVIGDFIEAKDIKVNFFDNFISRFYQIIVPKNKESFEKLVEYCDEKGLKGIGILNPDAIPSKGENIENSLTDFLIFKENLPEKFKSFLKNFLIENSNKTIEKNAVFINGDYYFADSGIYYIGTKDENGFLSLKARLKEIELKLIDLKGNEKAINEEIDNLKFERDEILNEINRVNINLEELQEELNSFNTEFNKNNQLFELKQQEKSRLEGEIERLKLTDAELETKIKDLSSRLSELNEKIEKSYEKKEKKSLELNEIKEQLEYMQEELSEIQLIAEKRNSVIKSIEKELEFIKQRRKEIEFRMEKSYQDKENDKNTIATLEKEIENLKTEANTMVDAYRKISAVLTEKKEILEKKKSELSILEKKVFDLRRKEEELTKAKQEKEIKKAEFKVKFNNLKDYQISRFGEFKSEKTENFEELNIQFEKLSRRIENFGAINLLAIEECDEQEKRYNFLMEQKKDLEKSIKNLTRDIREIDQTTKTLFSNAFDFINKKFDEIFKELFGGGKAYLKLSDEENVLDSGVEIYAKVPGETIKRISLLSGGEKAKTALAFVFALFEYRVAPLCVLDEVDAPLDEANVLRFGKFLKRYKDRVQFIVITHNKTTMELCDYLYGVTLEEPGCSKVLSVRLEDYS